MQQQILKTAIAIGVKTTFINFSTLLPVTSLTKYKVYWSTYNILDFYLN